MSFENHNTKEIDYEYRKRDLATKYSYAVSRLGTCDVANRIYWQTELEKISRQQADLSKEYNR